MKEIKIIVVGGGPAGYAAAIRAAQLGAKVVLAESGAVGGTCLNVGCIPTKTLLHIADFYKKAAENLVPGVKVADVKLDWSSAQSHKDASVKRLVGGVTALLRHNGVEVYNEKATLLSNHSVKIGDKTCEADAVIIATGSSNSVLSIPGIGLDGVMDSTAALSVQRPPKSLLIIGGGVIGVEFASMFSAVKTEVTLIEFTDRLIPMADADISEGLRTSLAADGVIVHTGAKTTSISKAGEGFSVCFEKDGVQSAALVDAVLVAAGRSPNTEGIGLEKLGVKLRNGAIETDEFYRTNLPDVYAIGDCNGKILLAHAAMAQGESVAEHILGHKPQINHKVVPACIYTSPEIASVGLTEDALRASGAEYSVGMFGLSANARSLIEGSEGFVKIIADKEHGEVLGVHIMGPFATELISTAAVCMSMEGTVDEIISTIHAHPTVGESIREAALSVFGKPIHGIM